MRPTDKPMTSARFRKRTKSLKKDLNKLIDDRIEKVIKSGCVKFSDYTDNYLLPKIFLSAMGYEITWQFGPFEKKDLKQVEKIKHLL